MMAARPVGEMRPVRIRTVIEPTAGGQRAELTGWCDEGARRVDVTGPGEERGGPGTLRYQNTTILIEPEALDRGELDSCAQGTLLTIDDDDAETDGHRLLSARIIGGDLRDVVARARRNSPRVELRRYPGRTATCASEMEIGRAVRERHVCAGRRVLQLETMTRARLRVQLGGVEREPAVRIGASTPIEKGNGPRDVEADVRWSRIGLCSLEAVGDAPRDVHERARMRIAVQLEARGHGDRDARCGQRRPRSPLGGKRDRAAAAQVSSPERHRDCDDAASGERDRAGRHGARVQGAVAHGSKEIGNHGCAGVRQRERRRVPLARHDARHTAVVVCEDHARHRLRRLRVRNCVQCARNHEGDEH